MFNWLKNYISPPASPELAQVYREVRDAKVRHDVAYDEYKMATEKMLKRLDRAHRVVEHISTKGGSHNA